MKNKLKLFTILLLLVIFFIYAKNVNALDATATIQQGNEQTFTGRVNISATTSQANISGIILYYRTGTSGAWSQIDAVNNLPNLTTYYFVFNTPAQTDSATAQINVTSRNYTMGASEATNPNLTSALVSINIDNTAPVVRYRIPIAVVSQKSVSVRCESDELDPNGNTTVTISMDKTDGLTIETNNTVTSTLFDNVIQLNSGSGTYSSFCTVIDGQGNQTRTTSNVFRYSSDVTEEETQSAGQIAQSTKQQKTQETKNKNMPLIIFAILVIIILIIMFIMKFTK